MSKVEDAISQLLFNKDYYQLNQIEITILNEYCKDVNTPKYKPLIINNKYTGYKVSNIGIIIDRNGREAKLYSNNSGYKSCWIYNPNSKNNTPILVHRAVAESFIPNPENKPEVNHKNCNKSFNWVGNLEWVTHQENISYGDNLGHRIYGMKHKMSKCTDDQIHYACKLLEENKMSLKDIARLSKVSIRTITHIRFDGGWPHISSHYKIPTLKRNNGPRFSPLSILIREDILNGKNPQEIFTNIKMSELSIGVSDKSIKDRIYHIRKLLNK